MTGVITGGWGFVVGAYALTGVVLGIYVISVLSRHSREFRNLERQSTRATEVE